jgi:hypothetical protein
MEHVVFYPAASGVPAFRRVGSLDEAVAFVEHLRNAENVTDFSVHELNSVQLSFRAYYHAEIPAGSVEQSSPEPVVDQAAEPVAEDVADTADETEAEPVDEAVDEPVAETVAEQPEQPSVPEVAETSVPALAADVEPEPEPETEPASLSLVPDQPVEEPSDEVTPVPAEADDDRSAEWVAEATVVEPPAPELVEAPAVEEPLVPALAADEPVVAAVTPFADPVAEEPAAEADGSQTPAPRAPFADAPPVTAPAADASADPSAEDGEPVPATGDVIPALAPTGRRSLGFFAR